MSRLRISNAPDGWLDEGEGYARVQGYRGEMVVGAPTPGTKNDRWITAYQKPEAEPIELKKPGRGGKTALCGRYLERQDATCAKRADHFLTSQCKSRAQLDRDVAQKREKWREWKRASRERAA